MPEFYRKNGVVGSVRYREGKHRLVHAHFIYAEYELSVDIREKDAVILAGNMPPNKRKQIEKDLKNPELRQKALSIWPQ